MLLLWESNRFCGCLHHHPLVAATQAPHQRSRISFFLVINHRWFLFRHFQDAHSLAKRLYNRSSWQGGGVLQLNCRLEIFTFWFFEDRLEVVLDIWGLLDSGKLSKRGGLACVWEYFFRWCLLLQSKRRLETLLLTLFGWLLLHSHNLLGVWPGDFYLLSFIRGLLSFVEFFALQILVGLLEAYRKRDPRVDFWGL